MYRASMLPEELLWHRNREGETCYLGSFPEGMADTVIMPPGSRTGKAILQSVCENGSGNGAFSVEGAG